jgi:outer membrane protein assembly factor BamA
VRGYWENQLGPRVLTVPSEELLDDEVGCTPGDLVDGTCDPSAAPIEAFRPRPLGGTTLLQANVEYRFPLWGTIRGAVFVDGAIVGERAGVLLTEGSGAITPGFGARIATPIGPMRLDFGIRPSLTEELPVVTDFVDDDGVRHLVHLQETRSWNPSEAQGGGFFNRALSHLTLHLSIGEAF